MTSKELREQVEQLVVGDELDEAIRLLLGVVTASANLSSFRDDVILLLAQIARLRRDQRSGVLPAHDLVIQLARIRQSILSLLSDIERRSSVVTGAQPQEPIVAQIPSQVRLEKIVGAVSHLKSIAWLARGLEAARSVCRIVTPEGLGTGFMIRAGVVATNHHVLPSQKTAAESWAEFNFQETLNGTLERPYSYRVDASSWAGDKAYDCAIARLIPSDEKRLDEWGVLTLETSAVPAVDAHVSIIQHPKGGPKQIAVTANQVVNIFEHRLQYTTDTLPGSSGSPVFNDDWKVVAIHHAGGDMQTNERGDTRFLNEGVLVKYLDGIMREAN